MIKHSQCFRHESVNSVGENKPTEEVDEIIGDSYSLLIQSDEISGNTSAKSQKNLQLFDFSGFLVAIIKLKSRFFPYKMSLTFPEADPR